jgi:hypothetical protein
VCSDREIRPEFLGQPSAIQLSCDLGSSFAAFVSVHCDVHRACFSGDVSRFRLEASSTNGVLVYGFSRRGIGSLVGIPCTGSFVSDNSFVEILLAGMFGFTRAFFANTFFSAWFEAESSCDGPVVWDAWGTLSYRRTGGASCVDSRNRQ